VSLQGPNMSLHCSGVNLHSGINIVLKNWKRHSSHRHKGICYSYRRYNSRGQLIFLSNFCFSISSWLDNLGH
jgi:hypothetical protein